MWTDQHGECEDDGCQSGERDSEPSEKECVRDGDARHACQREPASGKGQSEQGDAGDRGDGHWSEVVSRQEHEAADDRADRRRQNDQSKLSERADHDRLDGCTIVAPDPTRSTLPIRCYFQTGKWTLDTEKQASVCALISMCSRQLHD
ncbi:MAG: hypothetical protein E6I48_15505 [Chloroflexi bacterium]|nr:MAG: hypothetical protein E6I48_15505 [Chloroflexota bacterium]